MAKITEADGNSVDKVGIADKASAVYIEMPIYTASCLDYRNMRD